MNIAPIRSAAAGIARNFGKNIKPPALEYLEKKMNLKKIK